MRGGIEPVQPEVLDGCYRGRRGDIAARDRCGPASRRIEGERASIGEAVEHPQPCAPAFNQPAVLPVVQEQTGLLSFVEVGVEPEAMLFDDEIASRRAAPVDDDAALFCRTPLDDAPQAGPIAQGLDQPGQQRLRALRVALDDGAVAVEIDDNGRQSVCLAVDPAVGGRAAGADGGAHVPGAAHPFSNPGAIRHRPSRVDADGDGSLAVPQTKTLEPAAADAHPRAGGEGRGAGYLVAVYPGMTLLQPGAQACR